MDAHSKEKIPSSDEIRRRIGENAKERRYLRQLLKVAEAREQMRQEEVTC